ncbi:MAG: lysine--tRNA ligase [Verrucomicrobia bacterium]|nr:lysine--tRNA ligase [Verrucomicrobiota bacterium]MDA1067742.1 lysine--tRNA ligase [Verrucomicrobiota bacterium]
MSNNTSDNSHDLFAVRKAKLDKLREDGIDPFRQNWDQTHTSTSAKALYKPEVDEQEQESVSVAGRITNLNVMGKAMFAKILDRDGKIQIYAKRDELGEEKYFKLRKHDIGDIIGVSGPVFVTQTGEITVRVLDYAIVSKSMRPLPEKWAGLTDNEKVYRNRHLDLIVNDESRERFKKRSAIISCIRRYLEAQDFMEVETSTLHHIAGGAAARPFVTHFNALDCDFYLRIALELHLKRLLVGGFDRIFEIGRVFRNEGLSRRHNPEFTMLEVYQAYSDFRGMMTLIHGMIQTVCKDVLGTTTIANSDGIDIELGGEWREVSYKDLVLEATKDDDWFSRSKDEKLAATQELGIKVNPDLEDYEITNNVFEKLVEPTLIQPTFVTHIPKELCPLAKLNENDPGVLDVFELCINGQEIAPAYSEQNDPFIQKEMFEAQLGEETQDIDTEFLAAMEQGMPPAGGMGVGIDRLIILLTGAANIRDTILFPALRPEKRQTNDAEEGSADE